MGLQGITLPSCLRRNVVDYSITSASGLLNLGNLDWDAGVLEMLGLPEEKLSCLVPTTHVVEELKSGYAERLGASTVGRRSW